MKRCDGSERQATDSVLKGPVFKSRQRQVKSKIILSCFGWLLWNRWYIFLSMCCLCVYIWKETNDSYFVLVWTVRETTKIKSWEEGASYHKLFAIHCYCLRKKGLRTMLALTSPFTDVQQSTSTRGTIKTIWKFVQVSVFTNTNTVCSSLYGPNGSKIYDLKNNHGKPRLGLPK